MRKFIGLLGLILLVVGCQKTDSKEMSQNQEVVEEVVVSTQSDESEDGSDSKESAESEASSNQEEISAEEEGLAYEPLEGQYIYEHGPLKVVGTHLEDKNGEIIQLRGMSTHGVHFQGSLINVGAIGTLVNDWRMRVLRAAMYIEEDGYLTNPDYNLKKLEDAITYGTYYGIYVVADWHVHRDQDPMKHVELAKEFFDYLSSKYKNYDNIIYEICNEPNGNDVTWDNNIKPYAEIIIPIIRANDPNAIIVVGTGSYSQDIQDAADNPLEYDNIMYTCHFYAGSHGQWLRDRISYAMEKGLAVFVTEWGTSANTGGGGVYPEESTVWLDFLDENHISWANWSIAAIGESSAILYPNTKTSGNWPDDRIKESGHFVRNRLTSYEVDY